MSSPGQNAPPDADPSVRARVLALVRRHGWNATSFQVLEGGYRYWFEGDDACVAYVDTGSAWVAAGAPLAAEQRLEQVAAEFVSAAARARRSACFFATEQRFVGAAGFEHLLIGEQPVWDPRHWQTTLRQTPSLREQLRRARAKGVSVSAAAPEDYAAGAPLRGQIEALITSWQGSKPMPPMGFLVRVEPFELAAERRLFVAKLVGGDGVRLVGFAAVVPVYARNGWFIDDLIRDPTAPNGTMELLIDAAMNDAAAAGSDYMTLGLSPLAGDVAPSLSLARRYATPLYDFVGLRAFKAKLRPERWMPIHLSYPAGQTALGAVYQSLRAFAQRGLGRYGVETLLRGPAVVLRALAFLLIPWTLLLASLPSARWFPAPWVQWAWVAFDLILAAALLVSSRRFRPWLSRLIVVLVSLDACITSVQAIVFNLEKIHGFADAAGVLLAVAAPLVASFILANADRRARRVYGR
jgi:phosphatidylglycerol lysyltransferase